MGAAGSAAFCASDVPNGGKRLGNCHHVEMKSLQVISYAHAPHQVLLTWTSILVMIPLMRSWAAAAAADAPDAAAVRVH